MLYNFKMEKNGFLVLHPQMGGMEGWRNGTSEYIRQAFPYDVSSNKFSILNIFFCRLSVSALSKGIPKPKNGWWFLVFFLLLSFSLFCSFWVGKDIWMVSDFAYISGEGWFKRWLQKIWFYVHVKCVSGGKLNVALEYVLIPKKIENFLLGLLVQKVYISRTHINMTKST